jgi:flagellar export protein FliJ
MKKFKFRLERVLQYRHILKDERMRILLECQYRLKLAREKLEELERAAFNNEMPADKLLTAEEVLLRGIFSTSLKDQIVDQRLKILEAEECVQAAMSEYIEASKDAKTLDTLKARRRAEYEEYVQKEETKFLDELATQKGNHLKAKELAFEKDDAINKE